MTTLHTSLAAALLALLTLVAAEVGAQMPLPTMSPPPVTPAPEVYPDLPEYRVKSLPRDTFKSSEKVSEDSPIAFPSDI